MIFWKSPIWERIQQILANEKKVVQPTAQYLFRPFIETPLDSVRVVILGREPTAMMDVDGLAYSSPTILSGNNFLPHTLENIHQELINDVGCSEPRHGSLVKWAKQGVLLWNATPTVRRGFPFSHLGIGWEHLTLEVIETCYLANPNTVFLPWGDTTEPLLGVLPKDALIIPGPGPGVQGAQNGWWKSKPFSRTNRLLKETGQKPIDWSLN